jgi:glucokinase
MNKKSGASSILVGDIGGTRTRLSLYDSRGKSLLYEAVLPSREHATFDEIALRFLSSSTHPHPAVAVLGVAGPIRDRVATVTNLPWRLDETKLARSLSIPVVVLANDLVVAARGCLHLPSDVTLPLTDAKPIRGHHMAVIAAGTGLGEARLVWDGSKHLVLPTEGGHADFAPRTPIEIEVLQFLAQRFPDHVSYERVLSGDGLGALYDFFAARARSREPKDIARRLAEGDRNAAIAELGLSRAHRPAAQAVDLFATIYGAEAGNLALKELALGGVFVAGNIGRHIVPARSELFLEGFRKKGRFAKLMSSIPVVVVTDPLVGVHGALAMAKDLLGQPLGATSATKPQPAKKRRARRAPR